VNMADLRNLDFSNIGGWPGALKGIAILILCAAVLGAGFYFFTQPKMEQLEQIKAKEGQLKNTFTIKQRKAANLQPLTRQLALMKESLSALLRLLPNKTEIEGLLVDISQSGLASGLEFELFKPGPEQPADFYAIQPITIRVTGGYHEFGKFIGATAALSRIVTQHDIVIRAGSGGSLNEKLTMDITAKTYRYLDEDEIEAGK